MFKSKPIGWLTAGTLLCVALVALACRLSAGSSLPHQAAAFASAALDEQKKIEPTDTPPKTPQSAKVDKPGDKPPMPEAPTIPAPPETPAVSPPPVEKPADTSASTPPVPPPADGANQPKEPPISAVIPSPESPVVPSPMPTKADREKPAIGPIPPVPLSIDTPPSPSAPSAPSISTVPPSSAPLSPTVVPLDPPTVQVPSPRLSGPEPVTVGSVPLAPSKETTPPTLPPVSTPVVPSTPAIPSVESKEPEKWQPVPTPAPTPKVELPTVPVIPPTLTPPTATPAPVTPTPKELPSLPPGAPFPESTPLPSPFPGTPTYQVEGKGESLRDIAKRTLGSSDRWPEIYSLNPHLQPELTVPPGKTVKLPPEARVGKLDPMVGSEVECEMPPNTRPRVAAVRPLPVLRAPTEKSQNFEPMTGTFVCPMEGGAFTLPREVIDQLGKVDTALLTPGPDGCLWFGTQHSAKQIFTRVEKSGFSDADIQSFRRLYYSQSEKTQVDRAGKISIPAKLADYAGLGKEIVLIGIDDHFEIWDGARWARYSQQKESGSKH